MRTGLIARYSAESVSKPGFQGVRGAAVDKVRNKKGSLLQRGMVSPPLLLDLTVKKRHDAGVLVNSSTVEIYSADWCGVCTKTKAYFRSKGVAFTEYNVDNDSSAASRARSLYPSGGIPVTVINGKTIVGYSPSQFEAALHVQ